VEIAGSASGRGLTNYSEPGRFGLGPTIAVGGGRICVAWDEREYRIRLLCTDE
jgi:hypothetical protein